MATIREATPQDLTPASKVCAAAFWDDNVFGEMIHPYRSQYPDDVHIYWLKRLRQVLGKQDHDILVAVNENGEVVGLAHWIRKRAGQPDDVDEGVQDVTPNRAADPKMENVIERLDPFVGHIWSGKRADCWYLATLGVSPSTQGQGVGKRLVHYGFDKAKQEGVPVSVVSANGKDGFYKKCGFTTFAGNVGEGEGNPLRNAPGGNVYFTDVEMVLAASVTYKKVEGRLVLSNDQKKLQFGVASQPPTVTIAVADISSLQQTPKSSAKVALKVFVKDENYTFFFTSKENARKEQEDITNVLHQRIAADKAGAAAQLLPKEGKDGASAAMAIARAVSSQAQTEDWYDANKLRSNVELQKSLLTSNKPLEERFMQALRERPESISIAQFTTQFWSTRLHLLRAHAMSRGQREGEYNVLPEIKYKTVMNQDNEPTKALELTSQQIKLILKQYPVVRQAYDETVPGSMSEQGFWERFFHSKLLKKLKGERYDKNDPPDPILDRYLDHKESRASISGYHIPHLIDLEGNEQNTTFKVHREGWEMRADRHDEPILHTLNNISTKLLSHVAPQDSHAHGPVGMDEEAFKELQLRDLAKDGPDTRVILSINENRPAANTETLSADAQRYTQLDPNIALSRLRSDLDTKATNLDDTADEESLSQATNSVLSSIRQRNLAASSNPQSLQGLSQQSFKALLLTHNTTTEFLHYFWTIFRSGDASKAGELAGLVATFDKSLDRIRAVADQAEKERQVIIQEKLARSKRRKVDENAIGGGKATVEGFIRPTVEAIKVASDVYKKELKVQGGSVG
ncbi:hypothetical protein K470DRAFT_264252 [Piedraia hortae CBS 480.64]|uniref:BSD domain-containing protein n=1 Tax=Piedraia hortae CBS 480.64 TaxID=1314780 RepID=A0A6A7BZG5_9PEZI|nr:hypothetical protein K470DRAFT_264252 [Piedraia hortae CBS 480.64]